MKPARKARQAQRAWKARKTRTVEQIKEKSDARIRRKKQKKRKINESCCISKVQNGARRVFYLEKISSIKKLLQHLPKNDWF